MNVEAWLRTACMDADERGLPELKPLLETLARSIAALRQADENHRLRVSPNRPADSSQA